MVRITFLLDHADVDGGEQAEGGRMTALGEEGLAKSSFGEERWLSDPGETARAQLDMAKWRKVLLKGMGQVLVDYWLWMMKGRKQERKLLGSLSQP